jgi:hypothetical protein
VKLADLALAAAIAVAVFALLRRLPVPVQSGAVYVPDDVGSIYADEDGL